MKRRNFLMSTAIIGASLTAASCSSASNGTDSKNTIVHSVYFWLNPDLSKQEVEDFKAFFEELRKIPNIKSLEIGQSANTNPRDVVDNSFTYHLIVKFDTMDAINVYETHPIHLEAIEKFKHNWIKVEVKDSIIL